MLPSLGQYTRRPILQLRSVRIKHRTHPPILKREVLKFSKHNFKSFGDLGLVQFRRSICLEFATCLSAESPHSEFKTQFNHHHHHHHHYHH